ncbi:MAG: GNAT family N-acetyltransferase [Acidimicrobiia bacterium]
MVRLVPSRTISGGHGASDVQTSVFSVGRALIAAAREHLRSQGFTEACLWVLVGNDRAERFYRADGWVSNGTRRVAAVHGVVVNEVRYDRHLV